MTLYEIDHAISEAFEQAIDPETGELINEEAWAQLEALQMDREQKLEGVALWVKDLNAEAAAIKVEEDALKKRRQSTEKKADSLKGYLASALGGSEKFKTARVAISWRRSETAELLDGVDPVSLPLEYQRVKVAVEPDKAKLKEALKAGKTVEGVELVERQNIQIK